MNSTFNKTFISLSLVIICTKCDIDVEGENQSIQIENLITSEESEQYTFQIDTFQYTFQLNLESEIYKGHYGSEKYVSGKRDSGLSFSCPRKIGV
jgi:hypothetical protein